MVVGYFSKFGHSHRNQLIPPGKSISSFFLVDGAAMTVSESAPCMYLFLKVSLILIKSNNKGISRLDEVWDSIPHSFYSGDIHERLIYAPCITPM